LLGALLLWFLWLEIGEYDVLSDQSLWSVIPKLHEYTKATSQQFHDSRGPCKNKKTCIYGYQDLIVLQLSKFQGKKIIN
jgi:hypothetical protein